MATTILTAATTTSTTTVTSTTIPTVTATVTNTQTTLQTSTSTVLTTSTSVVQTTASVCQYPAVTPSNMPTITGACASALPTFALQANACKSPSNGKLGVSSYGEAGPVSDILFNGSSTAPGSLSLFALDTAGRLHLPSDNASYGIANGYFQVLAADTGHYGFGIAAAICSITNGTLACQGGSTNTFALCDGNQIVAFGTADGVAGQQNHCLPISFNVVPVCSLT